MRVLYYFLFFTVVANVCNAQGFQSRVLTKQQLKEDINLLKTELEKVHPDLYLYTSKKTIDSLFKETLVWADTEKSSLELFRKLSPIISVIRNNHTVIKPPKAFRNYLNSEAKLLPLTFTLDDDKLRILSNFSQNIVLSPGFVINKINGVRTDTIINNFLSITPTDGYNESFQKHSISRRLSRKIATFYKSENTYKIEYLNKEGLPKQLELKGMLLSEIIASESFVKKMNEYTFKIKNNVAIIKIPSFDISNLGKYNKFLKNCLKKIEDKSINRLIVDLRDNGGGRPEASNELFSYFIDKTVYPVKQKYALIDNLSKSSYYKENHGMKYFNKVKFIHKNGLYHEKGATKEKIVPKKEGFQGRTVVLINEPCASATTSLLGQLREHTDIQFMGTTAGGNPNTVVAEFTANLLLPNSQIDVLVPLMKTEKNLSTPNNALGVIPDTIIYNTPKEVQLGIDKVLDEAIKSIKNDFVNAIQN